MATGPTLPDFCIPSPNCVAGVKSVIVRNWRLVPSDIEELSKYDDIREIQVDSREIAIESVRQLARLPNLDSLSFTSSAISNQHVKELVVDLAVTSLSLFGPKVTDEACEYLRDLPLRSLYLPRTGTTDFGLQRLVTGCISGTLTSLSLFSTKISDYGISHLYNLTELETITLSGTNVSDFGIRQLPLQIVSLDLANTAITDSCAAQIRRMVNLEFLNVQRTSIGSDFVEVVVALPKLSVVLLDNTHIDDRSCDFIVNSPQLKEISLHATNLTKKGKTRLRSASHSLTISTDGG